MEPRMRACLVLLLSLVAAVPAQSMPGRDPSSADVCREAAAVAEREHTLPARLLAALARVESGRRDPSTGAFRPWPWTINVEGRGSFFPDKAAAIAAVQTLQAAGARSIDVGCLQINLRHHPTAFASLEEAFDPLTNARYAARFLASLQATRGDWMRAAGNYHSGTPELAEAYRARVALAWAAEAAVPVPMPSPSLAVAATQPAFRPIQPGGGFMLDNGAGRITAASPGLAGTAVTGRGLDAYRSLPIPVAGRLPAMPARL